MAEQTFRSPGFFEREVDLTQRTTEIVGTPAGVIGTAGKGPAFVPVTVGSFADFASKFGTLDPDRFGPYAANEWLRNRTALTYIRVLGAGANATTTDISTTAIQGTVKNAGFRLKGPQSDTLSAKVHNGVIQFIVASHTTTNEEASGFPVFTDNSSFNTMTEMNLVRAMVMTATGSRLEILSHNANYSGATTTVDSGSISSYTGAPELQGTFKLVLSSALGTRFGNEAGNPGIRILTASLDPSSKHYVGKILNTNPDRFHAEQHLLYADFPVESEIAKVNVTPAGPGGNVGRVAILSGSHRTSAGGGGNGKAYRNNFGRFDTRYRAARSTSFISQPFGGDEFDLFHFESLNDGEAGNRLVKISITNLRRSTDPENPYGTFTVLIRDYFDTDTDLRIVEQYPLCTLNPGDENYIATRIGDLSVKYNFDAESETERRLNVSGKRPNRSAYVRVVMNSMVEDGEVPADALPFGFRGVPLPKTSNSLTDNGLRVLPGGSKNHGNERISGRIPDGLNSQNSLTGSILPPIPHRFKATRGAVQAFGDYTGQPGSLELADSRLFWGIKFERVPLTGSVTNATLNANGSSARNKLLDSYSKFLGLELMDTVVTGSGADRFNDNKFTLAKVAFYNHLADSSTVSLASAITTEITGAVPDHIKFTAYIRNETPKAPRYTVKDGTKNRLTFGSLVANSSATAFNRFTEYMKFTNMMYGGYDGVNILDRDQRLMNDKASSISEGGKAAGGELGYINLSVDSSPGAGKDNNVISSYRTATRIMTDPFASRVNVIAIPGIRDSYVTDFAADKTKEYSQALYLMDVPSFDDDTTRLYDDSKNRPNVRKTTEQFEGRAIDNNFSAAYFPDTIIEDEVNGEAVGVPASVSAIGALGFNDRVSFPWFAPAGFNRGALDSVVNTEVRLNAEDRNVLYEARLNPIASFPRGGFVIFGQKTLQQARSALDRVNVRRMLLEVKRIVSDIANGLIFEQNTPATRARFVKLTKPRLASIQTNQGIDSFKIIMNSSNNTAEDAEQNRLNGRIVLVPTRAAEFIAMDFIITNSGVSFE